jgi:hypothetical protein
MLTQLASLIAAAFPPFGAQANAYTLHGFDAQNRLLYRAAFELPGAKENSTYAFMVVAGGDGELLRKAALGDDDKEKQSAAGQAMLATAEPSTAGAELEKQHAEVKAAKLESELKPFSGPAGVQVSLAAEEHGANCILVASWSAGARTVSGELLRDKLPPHPGATVAQHACQESTVAVAFRADGARAAVAWNIAGDVDPDRAHLAYLSPQDLAAIEVLDAGAGAARVAAFSGVAGKAGFRVALTAKARAKRPANAVYARKGFEAEAAQIAKLAGVGSIAPLDWDCGCAIAVALAK